MTQLLKPPSIPKTKTLSPDTTPPQKSVLKLGLWMFFWLLCIDIGINRLFAFPQEASQTPSSLMRYFDYGRSIEGKLNRMVKDSVENSDVIINTGWISPKAWENLPTSPQEGDDILLAEYGMSHSNDITQALVDLDGKITLRSIGGPSAPPNHSLAAFKADTDNQQADVVVMSVLASSVIRMNSLSGMHWTYENPTPYTYPYYSLNSQNELEVVQPVITTADDFVESFHSKGETWQRLKSQMRQHDQAFDGFVFYHNIIDYSAIMRLIRRGWANRTRSLGEQALFTPEQGFNPEALKIRTLKVMLSEFTQQARAADQTPVILLINTEGYGDSLYQVLATHIYSLDALLVSTHKIAAPDDPKNFLSDSHFVPEANREIAKVLQAMIRAERPSGSTQD